MKAKNAVMLAVPIALCVIFVIVPVFELAGLLCGLDFVLYNEIAVVITQALLAVGATVAIFILRPSYGRIGKLFLLIATPIALLNALCFTDCEWAGSIFLAIVWSGCIFAMYLKFLPDSFFKAASAVVSVLLTIAVGVGYLWGLISGALSDRKVESTLESMDGTYYAEVCVNDSLFGAGTEIYIKRSGPEFGAFLGSYSAPEMLVYEGEEHEAKTAMLNWLDDSTLIINGEAYRVYAE